MPPSLTMALGPSKWFQRRRNRQSPLHNGTVGPVLVLGGLVVLCLLALGLAMRSAPRSARPRELAFRQASPWVVAAMLIVGAVLLAIPGVPALVVVGLMAYAGVAVAATWRMVRLDRDSRWMEPSHRKARIVLSVVALSWLGIVLGLLLWIAAAIAGGLYGV